MLCNAEPESTNEQDDEPSQNNPVSSTEGMGEVLSDHLAKQVLEERTVKVNVNGKYECEPCQKTFSRRGLDYHKQSVHQGIKYACDQCDHQATDKSNLNKHIKSKHEGVKYVCDQCDYQAGYPSELIKHTNRHNKIL